MYTKNMAKGVMVNFRLQQEDLQRIDRVAETMGMTRSDFLRKAISEYIFDTSGETPVHTIGKRGKQKEKAVQLNDNCPKNDYCLYTLSSRGYKVCETCGFRR